MNIWTTSSSSVISVAGLPPQDILDFDTMDGRYIISNERLSDSVYSLNIHYHTRKMPRAYQRRKMSFYNVVSLFQTRGKLIFVIRRQDSVIQSLFRFTEAYASGNDIYLDFPLRHRLDFFWGSRSRSGTLLESFEYVFLILAYVAAFGRENVTVLLYEDLIHNKERYFRQLSEVFGEDMASDLTQKRINPSPEAGYASPLLVRAINRASGHRLARHLPKRTKSLTDREQREILGIFREGNRMLFSHLGIPNDYDYY